MTSPYIERESAIIAAGRPMRGWSDSRLIIAKLYDADPLVREAARRHLRLNRLTSAYADDPASTSSTAPVPPADHENAAA